ncbi:MAG: hypothetical protein RBU29_04495 [bacterium]|jgi:hypothetical protein|nr:hypothetical protein [bacterium]
MNRLYILSFFTVLILLFGLVPTRQSEAQTLAGCSLFPGDHFWNTPIDHLPVDPASSAYVRSIGENTGLHPDFGSAYWMGAPSGIPYTIVKENTPFVQVEFDYADESDPGPYPIPPDAEIEGGPEGTGDRHILLIDPQTCILYELFHAFPNPDGRWRAGSGAIFDLKSNALRPRGWTSADAAGLPILPGLARYEEVAAGEIRHALRFTCAKTRRAYVWPARHFASSSTDPSLPPMGQRFRLKAEFDHSPYSTQTQIILRALKNYGMILADNGSNWFISGCPNPGWDDDKLVNELRTVKGLNFEAVDCTSLMIDPDSAQAAKPTQNQAPHHLK